MRISYNWLKEYVDLKASPEKLAELLTMAGLSVESVSKLGGDSILEIEITANRPDWLSVIGVAREVAALTGGKLKVPPIVHRLSYIEKAKRKTKDDKRTTNDERRTTISVKVDDKKLCPRYTARPIFGVKVAESPAWLKARIEAMGLRSVNNIVDITNFCLFETGEPMHAFDLDRLAGRGVTVRRAAKGEKLAVIEGSEKALDDTMLIIADDRRPVAVAGVMGGLDTEVTASTKNILLEAAYFDPVSVRRTARKLGISTDSSYRFERRVDMENVQRASDRAVGLILELAGGEAGGFKDVRVPAEKPRTIRLRTARLGRVLGADIPPATVKKIVTALGMKIRTSAAGVLRLEAPGFRHDLKTEIDIIEEIARVYGYDRIPSTLPTLIEQPVRMEPAMAACNRMRECLSGLGADEIMTYSLVSKKQIASAGLDAEDAIDIKNPLTTEQEAMRPSLVPGMLGAMLWNINRKSKDLKLFELGNVYMKAPGGQFGERRHLCIGIAGKSFESWAGASREAGFFELKGIIEALLGEMGLKDISFERAKEHAFTQSACAAVSAGGRAFGVLGEVSRKVLAAFDMKEKVYLLEADAEAILDMADQEKRFAELPRYPSVYRDISIIAGKDTHNGDVVSVIRSAAGAILKEAKLIDMYKGRQIPEDKVSLTYRLEYQDPARTLEEKDVAEAHARVLRELDGKLGARLR